MAVLIGQRCARQAESELQQELKALACPPRGIGSWAHATLVGLSPGGVA